jgi:hypothetical protein
MGMVETLKTMYREFWDVLAHQHFLELFWFRLDLFADGLDA